MMKEIVLHRYNRIICCIAGILIALTITTDANAENMLRLQCVRQFTSSYGDVFDSEMSKPYETWYFMDDSYIYKSSGSLTHYEIKGVGEDCTSYYVGGYEDELLHVYSDSANLTNYWYGGSATYNYRIYHPGFTSSVTCSYGENIPANTPVRFIFSSSSEASKYTYHIFNSEKDLVTGGTSETAIATTFSNEGTYSIYVTAINADNDVSEYSKYEFNVVEATPTSIHSGTCGNNLIWTLDENNVLTINGTGAMEDYSSQDQPWISLGVKKVIIQENVTSIGNSAFSGCKGLTSITIPESVTSIGNSAFSSCSSLTNITIPDSVINIGNRAFNWCTNLTNITIPASVTSISKYVFASCSGLTNVTIPESVKSIGEGAFMDCNSLTNVTIPNSVTNIDESAFNCCNGLTSITIPGSVKSIGDGTFSYCYGLTNLTIPNSVTNIGSYAFECCTGLTSITIPGSVKSIGEYVFYNCPNVVLKVEAGSYAEEYAIGEDLNYRIIGESATLSFADMLQEYNSGASNTHLTVTMTDMDPQVYQEQYGSLIWQSTNEAVLTFTEEYAWGTGTEASVKVDLLSAGITVVEVKSRDAVGNSAKCTVIVHSAKPASTPKNLVTIGEEAFKGTQFEEIVLQNGVTGIGSRAFANCTELKLITIPDSVKTIAQDAFTGCDNVTILCAEKSAAYTYAQNNSLQCVTISPVNN